MKLRIDSSDMKVLLVNPPNCGKSIPEERYGIDSLKQILRGEPLSLEVLAGALVDHDVKIVDLKTEKNDLAEIAQDFSPDILCITGMTCEANTMVSIATTIKRSVNALVVVGGIHASNCPEFFNLPDIDYIVLGLGKGSLLELVSNVEMRRDTTQIPGVIKTRPGRPMEYIFRKYSKADLLEEMPPRYDLVKDYRNSYYLPKLGIQMGFVVTAYGCPHGCSFCSIKGQTGGKYITHTVDSVMRDIGLMGDIPFIRLVDANTFGNPEHSKLICQKLIEQGIRKKFLADVRADTIVRDPEMIQAWEKAGLRAVIVGFEEINDSRLSAMGKKSDLSKNIEAISILKGLGISIIGDFIVDPDYNEGEFDMLSRFVNDNQIDLPMFTILTPIPGTPLYNKLNGKIVNDDLDYYTLTNAVIPTRLEEHIFYEKFSELISTGHKAPVI